MPLYIFIYNIYIYIIYNYGLPLPAHQHPEHYNVVLGLVFNANAQQYNAIYNRHRALTSKRVA